MNGRPHPQVGLLLAAAVLAALVWFNTPPSHTQPAPPTAATPASSASAPNLPAVCRTNPKACQ